MTTITPISAKFASETMNIDQMQAASGAVQVDRGGF
jgi:hypothetical protein